MADSTNEVMKKMNEELDSGDESASEEKLVPKKVSEDHDSGEESASEEKLTSCSGTRGSSRTSCASAGIGRSNSNASDFLIFDMEEPTSSDNGSTKEQSTTVFPAVGNAHFSQGGHSAMERERLMREPSVLTPLTGTTDSTPDEPRNSALKCTSKFWVRAAGFGIAIVLLLILSLAVYQYIQANM